MSRLTKITQLLYNWLEKKIGWNNLPYLADWQQQQAALFRKKGLPSRKNEVYKHTPFLAYLGKIVEDPDLAYPNARVDEKAIQLKRSFQLKRGKGKLPAGIRLRYFDQLSLEEKERVLQLLQQDAAKPYDAFQTLNDALMQGVAWLEIAEDTVCTAPLQLQELLPDSSTSMIHQRLLITAGRGSDLQLIFTPSSSAALSCWVNSHIQISLAAGAQLHYYYLPSQLSTTTHTTTVWQETASSFYHYSHLHHNEMLRYTITTHLLGAESAAYLDGLYIGEGQNYQEIQATVHHHAPDTKSNVRYRGVVAGRAKGIFYGNVIVDQQAAKSNAHQSHRGWALTPYAHLVAYPRLDIHHHDVQCTHHATLQKIDDEALTYLRTRGIPTQKATQMLVQAFLEELLSSCRQEGVQKDSASKITDFLAIIFKK